MQSAGKVTHFMDPNQNLRHLFFEDDVNGFMVGCEVE